MLTVGHSNRSLEEFLCLLKAHEVALLVDVRTAPGSRRHPHFNREALAHALGQAGIEYLHMPELGGFRKPRPDSPNAGWEHPAFRGYADYMLEPTFEAALQRLIELSRDRTTAIMCSEAVPWRCHRRLIADALLIRGIDVEHIHSPTQRHPHELTRFCRPQGLTLYYPSPQPNLFTAQEQSTAENKMPTAPKRRRHGGGRRKKQP